MSLPTMGCSCCPGEHSRMGLGSSLGGPAHSQRARSSPRRPPPLLSPGVLGIRVVGEWGNMYRKPSPAGDLSKSGRKSGCSHPSSGL